jgi:peptidoglycan/LPS O-acetylase OafA/YrhL
MRAFSAGAWPQSKMDRTGRANGLDTLRAMAITLVFMYHYMVFVSHEPTFGVASVVGWVGVDLFFVLSGYLIANQILAGLAHGRRLSPRLFYLRRALRTLPAFWFVLALYFLFPAVMGGQHPPPLWRFLTFTQNFGLQAGTAFSHAWSLCMEEQFYLVLPVLVVAGARGRNFAVRAWGLLAALLFVGIVSRTVLWYRYGEYGYQQYIYYSPLCRFEEFLPGVALALLKNFHRPLWARITECGQCTLGLGALATGGVLYAIYHGHFTSDPAYRTFIVCLGFPLVAIAFAVLVLAALSPVSWLYRFRVPGAYHVALWSYSIYLSHKAIAFMVDTQVARWVLPAGVRPLFIGCACVTAGWLMFRLIEAPFMALRDRAFPSIFSTAGPPGRAQVR